MEAKVQKKSNIFMKLIWAILFVLFYSFVVPHLPDLLQSLTVILLVFLFYLFWSEDQKWIQKMRDSYKEDFYTEQMCKTQVTRRDELSYYKDRQRKNELFKGLKKQTYSEQLGPSLNMIFNDVWFHGQSIHNKNISFGKITLHAIGLAFTIFVLMLVESSITYFWPRFNFVWIVGLIIMLDSIFIFLMGVDKATHMLFSVSITNFIILVLIFLRFSFYGILLNIFIAKFFSKVRQYLRHSTSKIAAKSSSFTNKLKLCLFAALGIALIVYYWIEFIQRSQSIIITLGCLILCLIWTAIIKIDMSEVEDYLEARSEIFTLFFVLFGFVIHWNFDVDSWQDLLNASIALATLSYEINWYYEIEVCEEYFGGHSPKKFAWRMLAAFAFLSGVQVIKKVFDLH